MLANDRSMVVKERWRRLWSLTEPAVLGRGGEEDGGTAPVAVVIESKELLREIVTIASGIIIGRRQVGDRIRMFRRSRG